MGIRIGKLGKEDPLRAFDQMTVNDLAAAQRRRPERQIENMVQTERAEHPQDKTVQQRAEITRRIHQTAEAEDQFLKVRPYDRHRRADDDGCQRADNRYKA